MAEDISLSVDMRSFIECEIYRYIVLDSKDDIYEYSSFESPGRVKPRDLPFERKRGSIFDIVVSRLSWNVIRMSVKVKNLLNNTKTLDLLME